MKQTSRHAWLATLTLTWLAFLFASSTVVVVSETPCGSLTGVWFFQKDGFNVTIGPFNASSGSYMATCSPFCGWATAELSVDTVRTGSSSIFVTFFHSTEEDSMFSSAPGWVLGDCSAGRAVIFWGGENLESAPWCQISNADCAVPLDPFWRESISTIHLIQISHSDIGWLGQTNDLLVNARNINASLEMMKADPTFKWQQECMLFLRAYVEMYPEMEPELILRIAEGRFDIGGTFTEGRGRASVLALFHLLTLTFVLLFVTLLLLLLLCALCTLLHARGVYFCAESVSKTVKRVFFFSKQQPPLSPLSVRAMVLVCVQAFDVFSLFCGTTHASTGFESTMLNEILVRQMYTGRKWFLTRYPNLDSAVVAFHQDGPLRALQTAQVYRKAGIKYLKPSRYSEELIRWTSPDDGPGLLAFPQLHYCTGAVQWGTNVADMLYRMSLYAPKLRAAGLPSVLGITVGCDYAPPTNNSDLFAQWAAANATLFNGSLPALQYSTFKAYLDQYATAIATQADHDPYVMHICVHIRCVCMCVLCKYDCMLARSRISHAYVCNYECMYMCTCACTSEAFRCVRYICIHMHLRYLYAMSDLCVMSEQRRRRVSRHCPSSSRRERREAQFVDVRKLAYPSPPLQQFPRRRQTVARC